MHLNDCILFLPWIEMKDSLAKIYSTWNSHLSILQNAIVWKILIFCFSSIIRIKITKPIVQFILSTAKNALWKEFFAEGRKNLEFLQEIQVIFSTLYPEESVRMGEETQPRFWMMTEHTDKKTCSPFITSTYPVHPVTSHSVVQGLCQTSLSPVGNSSVIIMSI